MKNVGYCIVGVSKVLIAIETFENIKRKTIAVNSDLLHTMDYLRAMAAVSESRFMQVSAATAWWIDWVLNQTNGTKQEKETVLMEKEEPCLCTL